MPGRFAGQCLDWAGTIFATPTLATHATWVVGMAFRDKGVVSGTIFPLISILDGKATQVLLRYTKTGTLGKFSIFSNGVQLANGTTQLVNNVWYYIEFKATIGTSGSASFKINQTVDMTVSGVSTQVTSNSTANSVAFGSSGDNDNGRISMDDLYIVDGSGAASNDFLGDSVVETLVPNAAGNSSSWTASPAVANYLNVDDSTLDGDTTYVETSTGNAIDLYGFTNLSLITGNIAAVNLNILARNTDSNTHVIQRAARTASTNYLGSSQTISTTSYQNISEILAVNPNTTSAWDVSGVNGVEFGMKFIS